MRTLLLVPALALLCLTLSGCEDDRPPGASGGGPSLPGGGGGGGGADAGLDGGDTDGGTLPDAFCRALGPDEPYQATFSATRVADASLLEVDPAYLGARWECDTGYLRVVVGPAADCDPGQPGTLTLRFARDDLPSFAGSLPLPQPTLDPDADPLEIRFVASPAGTPDAWGTCDATASGDLVFGMALTEERNAVWQLSSLVATLPDCLAPVSSIRYRIDASFDFLLPSTFDEACR